ncbi:MAG: hypothetical protein V4751_01085 [Pseudomonadota bacterium]
MPRGMAQTSPPPNQQLNQLINAGQFVQAYELATTNLTAWEGDTEFDFMYGIAAIESNNPNEAVFAFERVALTAEDATLRQRARLELARAHLLTNNLVASRNLFTEVLESNPPQNVQENIEAFLTLIDARQNSQRSTFSFSVAPTVGHDDNINSATTNGLIDTPLIGEIELNPDGLKTGDDFADLTIGLGYRKPLTRDKTLDGSLTLNRHDNRDSDQFDMDYMLGDISYGYGSEVHRFRHSLQAQKVSLDGAAFQNSLRINNSWQRAGTNGWYQSLSASLSTTRFDNTRASPSNDLRDTNQIMLSGSIIKLTQAFTHSFTLFYADDKARNSAGKHNGRAFFGAAHSVMWRPNNNHSPYARLSAQRTDHHDNHPVFFNDQRGDTSVTGSIGWVWQYSRRLSANAELMYTETDSNIPLFEYTRFRYQAGLRYQL